MSAPSSPAGVAIITGGSSGIGLALANHLTAKNWHVFNLDIQPPIEPPHHPAAHTFLATDSADWDALAAAFATAYAAHRRLDLVALNAGIDDRDDIFHTLSRDPAQPPRKPNTLPFAVNLVGPYYGLKLAAHYMALPGNAGGKITLTSSLAGLHAHAVLPQYTATKHGVVGLARAAAPVALPHHIRVNCLCPSVITSALAPRELNEAMPAHLSTPMSTLLRAVDELCCLDALPAAGRDKWVQEGPTGATVLIEGNGWVYKTEEPNDRWSDPELAERFYTTYVARNVKYAQMEG